MRTCVLGYGVVRAGTRGPGVIGVVSMGRAHIDLRAGTYGGLNYSEFVLLALG
jgi:hypothetical protein